MSDNVNIDEKMGQYSEGQSEQAERAALEIFALFGKMRNLAPNAPEVFELVKKWQRHINEHYYECNDEILGCLGQFYATDENFVAFTDDFGKGTAQFMSDAIAAYCNREK